jgi:hypothetical protein
MNTAAAEKILAAGATAPRVSLEQVERAIAEGKVSFIVLPNGRTTVAQVELFGERFSVEGSSACVSKENFNQELGESFALKEATQGVWKALGTVLAWQLSLVDAAGPASGSILSLAPEVQTYVGTKVVRAVPMRLADYHHTTGLFYDGRRALDEEGYLVEYTDGGAPNVEGFAGYVSWSPKGVFEKAYTVGATPRATTWLERLKAEHQARRGEYERLLAFIQTDAYKALPDAERRDLATQRDCMEELVWLLNKRLTRATAAPTPVLGH